MLITYTTQYNENQILLPFQNIFKIEQHNKMTKFKKKTHYWVATRSLATNPDVHIVKAVSKISLSWRLTIYRFLLILLLFVPSPVPLSGFRRRYKILRKDWLQENAATNAVLQGCTVCKASAIPFPSIICNVLVWVRHVTLFSIVVDM